MRNGPRTRAFTLVELMIVMVVIAMLGAILLPILSRARELARRTKCQHNQEQIHHALILYSGDYRGWLPPAHRPPPPPPTNKVGEKDGATIALNGLGYLWEPLVAKEDWTSLESLQASVTCPSTNYWGSQTCRDPSSPGAPDVFFCSYLYRGGDVPLAHAGNTTVLGTQDDLETITQDFGKFILATDANHESGSNHHNHGGTLNISLLSDGSVDRRIPSADYGGTTRDFVKDLENRR